MPTEPLSDKEIAAYREWCANIHGDAGLARLRAASKSEAIGVADLTAAKALRLLDEVERSREMRRVIGGCPPEHGMEHALYCISCCAKFDPQRMALIHEQRCYFLIHERAPSLATSG